MVLSERCNLGRLRLSQTTHHVIYPFGLQARVPSPTAPASLAAITDCPLTDAASRGADVTVRRMRRGRVR
jgi:hypothetical protein